MRVGLIGCGRAGSSLALALDTARGTVRLSGVWSRSGRRAAATARRLRSGRRYATLAALGDASDLLLICVPDAAIAGVASRLVAAAPLGGKVVLHTSGALGIDPLRPLAAAGAAVGTLHPLMAFPPAARSAPPAPGTWFAVGGGRRAAAAAGRVVRALDGVAFSVPERSRAAYHLAASMIANQTTALAAIGVEILRRRSALRPALLRHAFAALLRSVAERIEREGPVRGLTGPAARGDLPTLRRHLDLLASERAVAREVYTLLSEEAVRLAARRGDLPRARALAARRTLRAARRRRR